MRLKAHIVHFTIVNIWSTRGQHMLPKNHFRGYRVPKKGCLSGVSAAEMGLSPTNDLKMDFNRDNKRGIIHITKN